jgi:general nucleoside transport system ATP-binding protein
VLHINSFSDDVLQDVNLELRQGEILGLVGVAGNGQKRLVEIVCGLHRPSAGRITILGKTWRTFYRSTNRDNLLSYIPEDRQGLATCPRMSLLDNFLMTTRHAFCRGPWLRKGAAREKAAGLIKAFDVQPDRMNATARQLSGGNLQKLVLAREFFRRPRLIVAEQPTQGLDIGATEEVWNLLLQARERAGILLVTGDLKEALSLSDRVAVIYSGKLVETFPVSNIGKVEQIGLMMAGLLP